MPWTTLRLAGRFIVPLALWYTVGQALRYLLFLGGYYFGLHNAPVPIIVISLTVMVNLAVTVAMLVSVKDGLPAVKSHDFEDSLTPWAEKADEEETVLDALTRALLPFMIFYLAWGWYTQDAKDFERSAASRGFSEGGIGGQIQGMKSIIALQHHVYIAVALTVFFFAMKFVAERWIEPKAERFGGIVVAFFEVNWTLFGIFSIDYLRRSAGNWITGRVAWHELGTLLGPVFGWLQTAWPLAKIAVLGALIWLVITGVVLGIDTEDEAASLGVSKAGKKLASASGLDRKRTPREVLTRELRDKWFPAILGFRLVFRAGILPFGVFCAFFAGLDVLSTLTTRGIYYLLGPHSVIWWDTKLQPIDFGVGLVHQMLRVCLLAAAFELVVARVSGQTAEAEVDPAERTIPDPVPAPPTPQAAWEPPPSR